MYFSNTILKREITIKVDIFSRSFIFLRDIGIFDENKENRVHAYLAITAKKLTVKLPRRPTIKSLRFPGSIDRANAIMPINHSTLGVLSPVF